MGKKREALPLGRAPFIAGGEQGSRWGRSQADRAAGSDGATCRVAHELFAPGADRRGPQSF
jgi:hypothetical protein